MTVLLFSENLLVKLSFIYQYPTVFSSVFYPFRPEWHKEKKGRGIIYEGLNMADYLLPEAALTGLEKQELFAIRTEMNPNPYNFGNKIQCEKGCQEAQDNAHILNCAKTNLNRNIYKLEDILNGSLNLKIKTFKSFQEQIIERNQLRDSVPAVNPL